MTKHFQTKLRQFMFSSFEFLCRETDRHTLGQTPIKQYLHQNGWCAASNNVG